MNFIIGTISPIKLEAATHAISLVLAPTPFTVLGHAAESGVSDTPWDEDTLTGARNRAKDSRKNHPEADYWVGLESGLTTRYQHIFEEAWSCILTKDNNELLGFSSGLKVPDAVLREMKSSTTEHRHVMKQMRKNSDGPKDTWGDYTGGVLLRTISLEESLRNTLIQMFAPKESYYHLF